MRNFSAAMLNDLRVNSLERPYEPDLDPIPSEWTPDHLSRRLVDAFATLRRMPRVPGPRQPGNHGPAYVHTGLDVRGWDNPENVLPAVAALGNPFEERKCDMNADRLPPSKTEILQMETCNEYLRWFRNHDATGALVLARWAMATAFGSSVAKQANALDMAKSSFYARRESGLKACAAMLNRRSEPVF
jgi:hypothetical protein